MRFSGLFSIGGTFIDEMPWYNNMRFGEPTSVVWIDYDNDGNLDLARSLFEDGIELYQGNGEIRNDFTEEGFQDVTAEAGLAAIDFSFALGMTWADFDNDGHTDFYVARAGGHPNRLMRNNGDGTFSEFLVPVVQDLGRGQSASFADYNLDGRADIFVARPVDTNLLYRNQGAFVDKSSSIAGEATDGSVMGVWGDYDSDGDPDLYVLNYAAPNRMYRNDATGFVDRISFSGELHDTNVPSYGANWVDYDNDGDLDLYVLNIGENNWLYRNDGVVGEDVQFTWMQNSPLALSEPSYSASWSDFNLDGHQDVAIANGTSSEPAANRFFFADGQGGFEEFVEHSYHQVRTYCIAAGDYQNDGSPTSTSARKGTWLERRSFGGATSPTMSIGYGSSSWAPNPTSRPLAPVST